jgi:outer membrane immunogenic protein
MLKLRAYRAFAAVSLAIIPAALLLTSHSTKAVANPLAPIWTGAYVGAQGGAKWSDISTDFSSNLSATDWAGGGHIGYNIGLGAIIVGVEADASLDSSKFSYAPSFAGGTGTYETDWSGTIRGRIGLPVGPALLYATAGYAWTDATLTEVKAGGASFSSSHSFNGVVYGLGAETYVLPNMSLRLEALRYDYSADKLSISDAKNILEEFDPSETVVRAGVTFHLN